MPNVHQAARKEHVLARVFVSGHARRSAWHQQEEAEATANARQFFLSHPFCILASRLAAETESCSLLSDCCGMLVLMRLVMSIFLR